VSLLILEPPYLRLLPSGFFRPPVGAALVADLSPGIPALAEAVQEHRDAPWCPLVTCLADRRVPAECLSAFEPVPGVFAPLYPGDYPGHSAAERALRAIARRPPPQPTTIALWVEQRLARPGTASTLGACFGDGGDELRPPRTLTRRVQALGSLEVRDWRGLARLVRILTTPLISGHGSLELAALSAGVDPRSLRRWLRLSTEMSWVEVVARAGWEWLVEMALRRFGYVEREVTWKVSGERYALSER
jgi:hypothetical protein